MKEDNCVDIEQYNKEIEEAMARMEAGEYYTHEQVVEMSKTWLSGR
jgi:predicted transcriptional regulator